jgi:SsrA-binding protein
MVNDIIKHMKVYAENRKARFNYEILEEFEAGIILSGAEVKSIRAGHISLKEAFATVRNGEIFLTNAHISPYKPAGNEGYDPTRSRKLLLNSSEITKLIGKSGEQGLTLVPLRVYDKSGKIKVEIGLAKGKKKYDKREIIKKREQIREVKRDLKQI